jgi:hypothetical protein
MSTDDSKDPQEVVAQAQTFLEEFSARAKDGVPVSDPAWMNQASRKIDDAYDEIGVALRSSMDMGELQQAAQHVLEGFLTGIREEGRTRGIRESLILIHSSRFGPPPQDLLDRINTITEPDQLSELVSLFATADEDELATCI